MAKFIFKYFNNPQLEYNGIIKAVQSGPYSTDVVEGENLLNHNFQTSQDIQLISETKNIKVLHADLKSIEIEKE